MSTPFSALPLPTQAGIMCNDPEFQKFAGARTMGAKTQLTQTAAAEYLRTICRIPSRRDLATNQTAANLFAALQTEFDAWRGRVAQRR